MAAKKSSASKVAIKRTQTVNTRSLARELAKMHEFSQSSVNEMLEDTIELIAQHLKKGARIRLSKLGVLTVRNEVPQMGRNPASGAAFKIKASKKIAFRPATQLKNAVTGGDGDGDTDDPGPGIKR